MASRHLPLAPLRFAGQPSQSLTDEKAAVARGCASSGFIAFRRVQLTPGTRPDDSILTSHRTPCLGNTKRPLPFAQQAALICNLLVLSWA